MKFNTYAIVTTFLAALFGAGFIAGKEIQYFFLYDPNLLIVSILIYFTILITLSYLTMRIAYVLQAPSFEKLVSKDNKYLQWFARGLYPAFAICLLVVFFSGFATLVEETFNIPKIIGSIVVCILVVAISHFGSDSISKLFKYSTPLLTSILLVILLTILLTTNNSLASSEQSLNHPMRNQFLNVILYGLECYQFSVLMLVTLGHNALNKQVITRGALITCLLFSASIFLVATNLINHGSLIIDSQIPLLDVVKNHDLTILTPIYTTILFVGFISVSLSIMFGYISFIKNTFLKNKIKIITPLTGLIALIFSQLSFSTLIAIILPIVGIIGFISFILIVSNYLKHK